MISTSSGAASAPLCPPVAKALRVTALDADAGDGIAQPHLTLHAGFHRFWPTGAASLIRLALRLRGGGGDHADAGNYTNQRNCDYECSPHSSLLVLVEESYGLSPSASPSAHNDNR